MLHGQAVEERCNEVIRAAKPVQAVAVPPGADHPLLHSPLLRGKLPPPGKVSAFSICYALSCAVLRAESSVQAESLSRKQWSIAS